MSEPLNPAEWPRWFHHVTLESVLCATPEDFEDLPEGYRKEPFSDDEKYAQAKASERAEDQDQQASVERLTAVLREPVSQAPPAASRKVPYRRPSRSKEAMAKRSAMASYPPKRKQRGGGVTYDDC